MEKEVGRPVNSLTVYASITSPSLEKAQAQGIGRSEEMIEDEGEKIS